MVSASTILDALIY